MRSDESDVRAESYPERLIREAIERGELEGLPGAGRPIPDLGTSYDPDWWAKRWIERTRRQDAAHAVAAETERRLARVWLLDDEDAVRAAVDRLNQMRREADRGLDRGDRIGLLDTEDVVRTWRAMGPARLRR